MNMRGSQKSKRITWAPDVNLCQVKLFSSAKPPSEVGMGRLQAKASRPVDPDMPPGFGKPANLKLLPSSRWRCPARIEINSQWQVEAGKESKEVEALNQRERRVLEAVYPQPSAIPPNPRLPVNTQESVGDDHSIPLIPLTPIEESDPSYASPMDIPQPQSEVVSSQCDGNSLVEAAKAALASVLSSSSNQDQRNLIDPDLLIRILTSPNLLQQLLITREQMPPTQNIPYSMLKPMVSSDSTSIPINGGSSLSIPTTKTELNAPTTTAPIHQPQLATGFVSTSGPHPSPPVVKDANYYKSLIQQHGGGGVLPQSCSQANQLMGGGGGVLPQSCSQANQLMGGGGVLPQSCSQSNRLMGGGGGVLPQSCSQANQLMGGGGVLPQSCSQSNRLMGGGGGVLPQSCGQSNWLMGGATQEFRKPMKSRIMKPCIYFNSNRGCKNGANCAYKHDVFSSHKRVACATEVLAAKRIKLG